MFITELSIKRPAVSWVMSLILIIFGLFVFWKLPVRELPDGIQPPVVQLRDGVGSSIVFIRGRCIDNGGHICFLGAQHDVAGNVFMYYVQVYLY